MSLASYVEAWRPEPVTDHDDFDPASAAALAAVLESELGSGPLPPLWHWVYFLERPRPEELGADGHPAEGHFLPPLPDRRRMIAGGRVDLLGPLEFGRRTERVRRLVEVDVKHGKTGEMVFVTVHSRLSQGGELRVIEEQDLVYRSGEDPGRAALSSIDLDGVPSSPAKWQRLWAPDPALLRRFSTLTGNAHRIHLDRRYATETEGYPGLVVHGPLLVLMMLELVRHRRIASVSYRLNRPVFAGEQVLATGGPDGRLGIAIAREPEAATARVAFRCPADHWLPGTV
jgi:3-methylfumaryl-CoA hydratase